MRARSTRPLVLVQTARREIGHAAQLDAHLRDREVVELAAPEMTSATMLTRVEQWVEHHRRTLDELALAPPHLLLGWSFGGVVALEIARAEQREGAPPSDVGLVDSIRPRIRPISVHAAVRSHLREAALLSDPDERRAYLVREAKIRVGRRMRRERAALDRRPARWGGRPVPTRPSAPPVDPAIRSIHRSYLNYEASPVTFPVAQFTTEGSTARCGGDPSLRWAPFLQGGFDVQPIAGGHHSLWCAEHLPALAAAIEQWALTVERGAPARDALAPRT